MEGKPQRPGLLGLRLGRLGVILGVVAVLLLLLEGGHPLFCLPVAPIGLCISVAGIFLSYGTGPGKGGILWGVAGTVLNALFLVMILP